MDVDAVSTSHMLPPSISALGLLEALPVGVIVVNERRELLFLNRWLADRVGRSIPPLLGTTLDALFTKHDALTAEQALELLFNCGRVARWDATIGSRGVEAVCAFVAQPIYEGSRIVAAQVTCVETPTSCETLAQIEREMQAFQELSRSLQCELEPKNVCRSIVNGVITYLGYSVALLALADGSSATLVITDVGQGQGMGSSQFSIDRTPLQGVHISLQQSDGLIARSCREATIATTHSFEELFGSVVEAETAVDAWRVFKGCSLATIPLWARSNLVGSLVVGARRKGFSQRELSLLGAVAHQSAMAIENARLYDTVQQRLDEVYTLYLLANQVSSSLDLNVVLDSVMEVLKRVLDCRGGCIFLLDENREWLEVRASSGIKPYWQRMARMRLGEGISGQVAETAQPVYIADTYKYPDFIVFDPAVRCLLVVPLIFQGEVIGTLNVDDDEPNAFSEDVTRLLSIAATQAAAAIQTAKLYTDLKERAERLEQAHGELQESERLRSEFIQNVSHELRTPLTFTKGYVELMLEETLGPLTERQRQGLGIVAERTGSVIALVDDILSLQRVERGDLQFAFLSLEEVARGAVQGAQAIARQAGLSLIEDYEPGLRLVWGDRTRLDQVFSNLIGNAVKFSPKPGGRIAVRLRNGERVVFAEVQDEGIGIPKDQLTKIFERFYQVDGSSTRRFGGTGLGLAIVKEIVDAHGGTIGVESEPNVGSTFSFTVPCAPHRQD